MKIWPLLAALITFVGCENQARDSSVNAPEPVNVADPAPNPQEAAGPRPPLERADLLLAAIRARSDAARGVDDVEAQRPLENRRFRFRIRLGCTIVPAGGDDEESQAAVYDAEARRLTLSATPDLTMETPLAAALAGEGVEAAEGFSIRQPWLLDPACAAGGSDGHVGLISYYTEAQSRTERRSGRPYQAVVEIAEGQSPAPGRWELLIEGRLSRRGDGRVIQCRALAEGQAPSCLISVAFEKVSIVSVDTGEELARWMRG